MNFVYKMLPFAVLVFLLSCFMGSSTNLTTDHLSLLVLKARITYDPYKLMANNWSIATTNASIICGWIGVSSGVKHLRVTALNPYNMGLKGTIPPDTSLPLHYLICLPIISTALYQKSWLIYVV